MATDHGQPPGQVEDTTAEAPEAPAQEAGNGLPPAAAPRRHRQRQAPVPRGFENEQLLTPAEVATLFRVDPKTVTRWAMSGKLPSVRTLGGHRRYPASIVKARLAASNEKPSSEPPPPPSPASTMPEK